MTTGDLVFLGGQFHFSIGGDGKIIDGHFVARIGIKAPDTVPAEFKATVEEKQVQNVEIRLSKNNVFLDNPIAALVPKAKLQALPRFAPPGAAADPGGEVIP